MLRFLKFYFVPGNKKGCDVKSAILPAAMDDSKSFLYK